MLIATHQSTLFVFIKHQEMKVDKKNGLLDKK